MCKVVQGLWSHRFEKSNLCNNAKCARKCRSWVSKSLDMISLLDTRNWPAFCTMRSWDLPWPPVARIAIGEGGQQDLPQYVRLAVWPEMHIRLFAHISHGQGDFVGWKHGAGLDLQWGLVVTEYDFTLVSYFVWEDGSICWMVKTIRRPLSCPWPAQCHVHVVGCPRHLLDRQVPRLTWATHLLWEWDVLAT